MTDTEYDPLSDTLACGCNPDWADHRCRYGCSVCGAPDDCYCPSISELAHEADMTIEEYLAYMEEVSARQRAIVHQKRVQHSALDDLLRATQAEPKVLSPLAITAFLYDIIFWE